jgi:hypothetical protein
MEVPKELTAGKGEEAGILPPGAIVWQPGKGLARFSIPPDPQFSDYSICTFGVNVIKAVPDVGGDTIQCGFKNLTKRSVDYRWKIKVHGPAAGHKTQTLQTAVYFYYIPNNRLKEAQDAGICKSQLKAEPAFPKCS